MPWHESWTAMQGINRRTWLTYAEFAVAVRKSVGMLTDTQIRRAIRLSATKPEKRYGTYRYERRHVRIVRAFAKRMRWIQEESNV